MRTRPFEKLRSPENRSGAASVGCLVKIVSAGLVGMLVVGILGYLTFFSTSHHETPSSMYSMYGDLTPSKATDITLHAAGLDHSAEYTVSEEGLQRFLGAHFESGVEGPEAVDREAFERNYRRGNRVDWDWHEGLVEYSMWKSRGTSHSILRDTRTGRTYQESAHW